MKDDSFKDYILEQLHDLGKVTYRRMFGGYGLYHAGTFFGILARDGQLYFKTSPASRAYYIKRGMRPFQPNEKQTLKNYYEVPADVIDDAETLAEWARQAVAAQKES